MKLTLLSEYAIRLEPVGTGLTIESASPEQEFSPFHMMAGALAHCSFSVLYVWGQNAKLRTTDLSLEVSWSFANDPYRVDCYDVRFAWPSLPAARLEAAKRVIEACTVHATLQHPPRITIDGTVATPDAPEPTVA
jgi:uncharacterized OsmC-like protein